jgi:predicted transcriptional regulator
MIVTSKNNYQFNGKAGRGFLDQSDRHVDTDWLIGQLDELDELHPLDFRLAFGLTHEEAAEELCLEPQTMRAYLKNNPSRRVKKLAATIAKKWLSGGRQLVEVKYLIDPR